MIVKSNQHFLSILNFSSLINMYIYLIYILILYYITPHFFKSFFIWLYASSFVGYDHKYFKLHHEGVSIPDLFQYLDSFFLCLSIYLCFLASSLCIVKSDTPAAPKYTFLLSLVII